MVREYCVREYYVRDAHGTVLREQIVDIQSVTPETLQRSVIAVPPLARDDQGRVCPDANHRIVRFLEGGGVTTLLYGGNAVFYHLALSEFEFTLQTLVAGVSPATLVIPSIGPAYGMMMDQIEILSEFAFPTAMVLPQLDVSTVPGRAAGIRRAAERWGRPLVVYLKQDGYLDEAHVEALMRDGCVSAIKYAIVRPDAAQDPFLRSLLDRVGAERVVSGMGEQPAIVHLRDFGLSGFTSGCVCLAPDLSRLMLEATLRKDWDEAERLRALFEPLEDLRNEIHPIRVLHAAVELAGVAPTGAITPLLSDLSETQLADVARAARQLLSLSTVSLDPNDD